MAGNYNIYMRWTSHTNRPSAAPLEIGYNGGTDISKTVNQQINGGTWVYIGNYNLSADRNNYVKILCSNPGYTIADAVSCVYTPPPALSDNFESGDLNAWTVVNGTWSNVLEGANHVLDKTSTGEGIITAGSNWYDLTYTGKIKVPQIESNAGLVFRYADNNNFYHFS